ncbi:hypothetical protein CCM_05929 [Cordyceps militaris CM01]|uniref:Uncharacterized protein n=1 Tax=Cordyceps militaris (strain CM01) TaxID=983644 RepID=G3JHR6_CORMM|nr:uncharacterized protein CCM_05929 [Cordyceps militaris CM01]EGX91772.1 hypothetical protein CCM_05929 [Cordyceps militaris CM01]
MPRIGIGTFVRDGRGDCAELMSSLEVSGPDASSIYGAFFPLLSCKTTGSPEN